MFEQCCDLSELIGHMQALGKICAIKWIHCIDPTSFTERIELKRHVNLSFTEVLR